MIELTVDAAGLARSRFAVSPLHEVVLTLLPCGARPSPDTDPWVTHARRIMRRARLPLLSELARDEGGYVPDFLRPHPSGPSPTVEEQLLHVRRSPPRRVLGELEALHDGRPGNGLAGCELPAGVWRAMDRGGAHMARQAADELRRYWDLAFAPHWDAAKATLDAEIDRCAHVLARHGAARLFNSLHPEIRWADGIIRVESRFRIGLPARLVVVVPSLVTRGPVVAVDPTRDGGRPPILIYPVRNEAAVGVRRGEADEEGQSVRVRRTCIPEPGLPRSTGLGPASSPPFSALTYAESSTTRDRSSRPASSRRCRTPRATAARYDKRAYVFHGTVTAAAIRLQLRQ